MQKQCFLFKYDFGLGRTKNKCIRINLPPYCKTSNQFVAERLSLCNRTKTPCSHFFGVQLNWIIGKVKSFLNNRCQFPDSPSFLSEHILRSSGHYDDLSFGGSNSDFHTRVTIFGKFSSEELIQLCFKNSISNKLKSNKMRWIKFRQSQKPFLELGYNNNCIRLLELRDSLGPFPIFTNKNTSAALFPINKFDISLAFESF